MLVSARRTGLISPVGSIAGSEGFGVVPDPLPIFAANLRRIRLERGMTQDALAAVADMDPAELRRLESARRDPGVRVLARLANGLGVTLGDLLAGVK